MHGRAGRLTGKNGGFRPGQCIWKYLDGNGVFIAGYNRNTTITNSELTQIGDSAIALWGYTEGADPLQPPGTGIDGSRGLQPRYVDITRNLCHEYGHHQKQSSCVFIAKSMFANVLEMVALAQGESVIWTDNERNDSKVTM